MVAGVTGARQCAPTGGGAGVCMAVGGTVGLLGWGLVVVAGGDGRTAVRPYGVRGWVEYVWQLARR